MAEELQQKKAPILRKEEEVIKALDGYVLKYFNIKN